VRSKVCSNDSKDYLGLIAEMKNVLPIQLRAFLFGENKKHRETDDTLITKKLTVNEKNITLRHWMQDITYLASLQYKFGQRTRKDVHACIHKYIYRVFRAQACWLCTELLRMPY
jgi:hypothetical protein